MLGGIIAIDMGDFQLAVELAADPKVASYAGILVAATLGCTVTFTIPVGMGMVPEKDRPLFARGILFGLILLPVSLFLGGLLTGLMPLNTIRQSLPVFLACLALALGIAKWPDQLVGGFLHFSNAIRLISTLGLIFGAFAYMTGVSLPFPMTPLEEAMKTVSSIGIVMLGSLPMAELLQRILKVPLAWLGKKTGMNSASMTGLLLGGVSVVPAIALIRDMDRRGKIVNAALPGLRRLRPGSPPGIYLWNTERNGGAAVGGEICRRYSGRSNGVFADGEANGDLDIRPYGFILR